MNADELQYDLDSLRQCHENGIREAYKLLGIEDDGELRMKWVLLEIAKLKRPAPSVKSGSVREAAEEAVDEIYRRCNPRNNPAASHGMISKPHMTELVANTFEGFVPREELNAMREQLVKEENTLNAAQADTAKLREEVERITSGYHRRADELDAQYRELISLRTQLKDMTAQFFAVSQEGVKMKALLSDALDELPLTDCDGRKNRVVIDLAQQIRAALQSSRAEEEGGQL